MMNIITSTTMISIVLLKYTFKVEKHYYTNHFGMNYEK